MRAADEGDDGVPLAGFRFRADLDGAHFHADIAAEQQG
jgi:hypothetical protein